MFGERIAAETPELDEEGADALLGRREGVAEAARPVVARVAPAARVAAERWRARDAARARRLGALNRIPLPNANDVYPGFGRAALREVGLQTIPVERIRGTAVAGPAQRGSDFLPRHTFCLRNWEARWQRIRAALQQLAVLPPIEVVRVDDDYWVLDGHNRVAAALYTGQVGIDALVRVAQLPGHPTPIDHAAELGLAAMLEDAAEIQAAVQAGHVAGSFTLRAARARPHPRTGIARASRRGTRAGTKPDAVGDRDVPAG